MKAGDKVTFTRTTQNGSSFRMSSMECKIISIENDVALVKYRNGRENRVHVSKLRPSSERSELMEMVSNMGNKS